MKHNAKMRMGMGGGGTLIDKVDDGGFDAVTETNEYTSDFTVDADGITAARGAVVGNIDAVGETDILRFTIDNTNNTHVISIPVTTTVGSCYRIRFKYYVPSGQSHIDSLRAASSGTLIDVDVNDAWISIDGYYNVNSTSIIIYAKDDENLTFQDAGGDDVFYLKDIIIDAVTFTNWTADAGWAPEAVIGSLTGKAKKTAGTASDLEQDIGAKATHRYQLKATATRTAGTLTPQIGGVNGTAITSSKTIGEIIQASGTENLKFQADDAFAGTVDLVSARDLGPTKV